mmetsp:Transcript_17758/g.37078  ORF Transcript_17758/g.37078 Transcript_17758/m.37078 type:complete len:168 (+) Transcript_17758:2123-2626(+)
MSNWTTIELFLSLSMGYIFDESNENGFLDSCLTTITSLLPLKTTYSGTTWSSDPSVVKCRYKKKPVGVVSIHRIGIASIPSVIDTSSIRKGTLLFIPSSPSIVNWTSRMRLDDLGSNDTLLRWRRDENALKGGDESKKEELMDDLVELERLAVLSLGATSSNKMLPM